MPEEAKSMGIPTRLPTTNINRPVLSYSVKAAPKVNKKLDKITLMEYESLPLCIYIIDGKFIQSSYSKQLINKIRGGGAVEAAAALLVLVIVWQIIDVGEIFIFNNFDWGLDRIHRFQPTGAKQHKYPPALEALLPSSKPFSSLHVTNLPKFYIMNLLILLKNLLYLYRIKMI